LWCDVRAFHQALEASDWSRALELYRGGLLEGFFLSDAPEFERWLEVERARLRNRACQAAWTLAQQSKAEGDFAGTAQWARRAAAQRPSAASIEPAARRFTLPGKRWVVGTIGLALLAAVMAIRHQQASARLSQVSVGIVPFEDRSEDTLDAYLGSALTEDLSRSLSAAHVLRVFRVRQARPGHGRR